MEELCGVETNNLDRVSNQRFETHVDHLINYIRYWQASGESKKIAIRTKTALGQMVPDGRFRGGTPPYGYRLVPSGMFNKRKHEVCKLEINEEEAQVIRLMFDLCVASGKHTSNHYQVFNKDSPESDKSVIYWGGTVPKRLNHSTFLIKQLADLSLYNSKYHWYTERKVWE